MDHGRSPARGIAILLGALTLISNFVVPYYEVWIVVLSQFGNAAWHVRMWYKKKGYLAGWSMQPLFTFLSALAFVAAGYNFAEGDGYSRLLAGLFLGAGFVWFSLLLWAAYAKDNAQEEQFNKLWDVMLTITTSQKTLADSQNNLVDNQRMLANLHDGIVKFNKTQAEVAELHHKETALLAAEKAD